MTTPTGSVALTGSLPVDVLMKSAPAIIATWLARATFASVARSPLPRITFMCAGPHASRNSRISSYSASQSPASACARVITTSISRAPAATDARISSTRWGRGLSPAGNPVETAATGMPEPWRAVTAAETKAWYTHTAPTLIPRSESKASSPWSCPARPRDPSAHGALARGARERASRPSAAAGVAPCSPDVRPARGAREQAGRRVERGWGVGAFQPASAAAQVAPCVRDALPLRVARRVAGPGADFPSALVAPPGRGGRLGRDAPPALLARLGPAGAGRVGAGAPRGWDGARGWGEPASRRAPRVAPGASFGRAAIAGAACRASSHRAAGRGECAAPARAP